MACFASVLPLESVMNRPPSSIKPERNLDQQRACITCDICKPLQHSGCCTHSKKTYWCKRADNHSTLWREAICSPLSRIVEELYTQWYSPFMNGYPVCYSCMFVPKVYTQHWAVIYALKDAGELKTFMTHPFSIIFL